MNAQIERDSLEIISTERLECEFTLVRGAAAGSLAGVFGPRSITWQVDREAAIFLGAGRALLLQLAHPWIAAAVEQHSDTFANPIGRFHRTFGTVFTMVFGTLAQSLEAARRLHHRHALIQGTLPSAAGPFPAGSFYCANEVSALRWVHATLVETAVMAYALVLPALTREQREHYYAESRLFAALFGIPKEHLARDWTAFAAYTEAMARSSTLTVTAPARVMAHRLLAGADTWLPIPAGYKALTAALSHSATARRKSATSSSFLDGRGGSIPTCPRGFAMSDLIRRPNNGLRAGRSRTWSQACATDFGWGSPLSAAGRCDGRVDSNGRYPNTARNAGIATGDCKAHREDP